jgi:heat shock protein HslJ
VLTGLVNSQPLEGTQILLEFSEAEVSGFAGCNSYGGALITADEGVLAVGEMAITMEGCVEPAGVLEQEAAYIEALMAATGYRLGDNRLELLDPMGSPILTFARKAELQMAPTDLPGSRWQLITMGGVRPVAGSQITMIFQTEDQLAGEAGCRGYVASYQAEGDDMGLLSMGMIGPADPCPEILLLQEGQYTSHLELVTNYRLGEGTLELLTAVGDALRYEPLPAGVDAALEGTAWILADIVQQRGEEGEGAPLALPSGLVPGTELTAAFEDGQVSGSAGCNSYSGPYTLDGSALAMGSLGATERWCDEPQGVMEQEQRYLERLRQASQYQINGRQLWLDTGGGSSLVYFAPVPSRPQEPTEPAGDSYLEGTSWILNTFVDGETVMSLLSGTEITAVFQNGQLEGSAGCNNYSGGYVTDGASFGFTLESITEMACEGPEGIMAQEQRYVEILGMVDRARLDGQQIWLETSDGRALVLAQTAGLSRTQ